MPPCCGWWQIAAHGPRHFPNFSPRGLAGVPRHWEAFRSEVGFEIGAERSEGFAPVADGRLGVSRLSERLSVGRIVKNRIVAEAAAPSGLRRDASFDAPARLEQHLAVAHERHGADEARGALGIALR